MPRTVLAAIAALLVLAAPAAAQPGDPLPEPISPVGGAAVAANPDGVALTFTCPAYRSSPADEGPSSDLNGYAARVSRDPSGANSFASSEVTRSATDPNQCTALVKDSAYESRMQETPGTYYWFVDRTCFCGSADTEAGPVASFKITAAASKLTAKTQKRAYAGYPIRVTLATDLPDGEPVALQRLDGKRWKTVKDSDDVASKGQADAVVTLKKGTQRVRWIAVRGTQTDTGAPLKVEVLKPRKWSTGKGDDGTYRGNPKFLTSFKVTKDGRELRNFRAAVNTYCVGSFDDVSKNYFKISFAAVPKIKVAPDGRFLIVSDISKTRAIVSGRLRNGKVTGGKLSLAYPLCTGGRTFVAAKK